MEKINLILAELFKMKVEDLDNDLTMEDIVVWDSLKHMELIATIEEAFSVELSIDDIMELTSIKALRTKAVELSQ
ncbi:acyl carrier protein [Thalassotalea sediminis]|uniref:acyl carrier protein n=1 Tax=Thalassotalea sediminis TaxID=1759089 RepID=UPI0025725941|nr:acyl carrier protein [Thalassotalea sediminis]